MTLEVESLAAALTTTLSDPSYTRSAQQVSRLLASEDGEGTAADIVASYLERRKVAFTGGS